MQSSAGLGAVLGSLGAVLGGLGAFGTPRTGVTPGHSMVLHRFWGRWVGTIGGGIKQLGSKNLATWLFSYLATLYIRLVSYLLLRYSYSVH